MIVDMIQIVIGVSIVVMALYILDGHINVRH
jgi:hypothetical protein